MHRLTISSGVFKEMFQENKRCSSSQGILIRRFVPIIIRIIRDRIAKTCVATRIAQLKLYTLLFGHIRVNQLRRRL